MRTPDKHRVEKAISHLDAAKALLTNIKDENLTDLELYLKSKVYGNFRFTKLDLLSLLNL